MRHPPGTPGPGTDDRARGVGERHQASRSTRADALNADGSLNQRFFKPKKVVYATEKAKWNDQDWDNLYRGIEKHGIDPTSWRKIIDEFCPGREVLFIRIEASRARSQGLNRYHGWIGCKADVQAEYERNKAIGACHRLLEGEASWWRTTTRTRRRPSRSGTQRRRPRGAAAGETHQARLTDDGRIA